MAVIRIAALLGIGALVLIGINIGAGYWSHHYPFSAGPPSERALTLQKLREGRFEDLESGFGALLDEYRAGVISDHVLEQAYSAFKSADPDLEQFLNAWIAARPESHAARTARAEYYVNLAVISRDKSFVRVTADDRFAPMRDYLDRSATDLGAALRINPHLGTAYGTLILIAMLTGDDAAATALMRKGLQVDPRSFVIRRRYVFSLVPWWNKQVGADGAYQSDQLLQFIAEIERDATDNAALAPLKAFGDYVVADALALSGRHEEAIPYFEQSLRFGNYWLYLKRQGENYLRVGRYTDAVASIGAALEAWPEDPDTLSLRARTYRWMDRFRLAFADWERALAIDPRNPDILLARAYGLRELRHYDEVLSMLDEAMLFGTNDAAVRDLRGRIQLYELDRPADALEDLQQAAQLDPIKWRHWYNYGFALYRTKDCSATGALAIYQRVCNASADCTDRGSAWAAELIEEMNGWQSCS